MGRGHLLAIAGVALLSAIGIPYASAQTYNVVYNFNNGAPDVPQQPLGPLAESRAGDLYGRADGENGTPTAFRVTPAGALTGFPIAWGEVPFYGGFTLMPDGSFYSVGTSMGGWNVFKMTPNGNATTLLGFAPSEAVFAVPISGSDGNFYGTTGGGGSANAGTVYRLTPAGAYTVLHSFNLSDGEGPGPLIQGTDGYFYGITSAGGSKGKGTIFRMDYFGHVAVLWNFDGTHGEQPVAPLVEGSDGNFYGTTLEGGSAGGGVIFRITTDGVLDVLYDSSDFIYAGLVEATDGNFYGITNTGVAVASCGSLFRITPTGTYTNLRALDVNTDGCYGQDGLLQHTNGLLYGTTPVGGQENFDESVGVLFSLDVGLGPFVRLLPDSRQVGHAVEILGQGFTGTSDVSFDGNPAAFTVVSDTYLTATVPADATSGFVTVTTPGGTLKSNKKFLVKPQITSFSPSSGPVGTSVVITGISLKQAWKVVFNGYVAAPFTLDSDTQVTVTVPPGAVSGKIGIKTTGAPVYSANAFTVTQ